MNNYTKTFERVEKKYLLNKAQYIEVLEQMRRHMTLDRFGKSEIMNIYYDTPDYRLIRTSLSKPTYKEKLRLRTYGVPDGQTTAFVELKKKHKGIVYKRRIDLPYMQAIGYMNARLQPDTKADDLQVKREIDYFYRFYPGLAPRMVLCYDRLALRGVTDPGLRITFDRNIRWRADHLDLRFGNGGEPLLDPGQCLMEIKFAGGMPLWLAELLSVNGIFPASFSKYGRAYETLMLQKQGVDIAEPRGFGALVNNLNYGNMLKGNVNYV